MITFDKEGGQVQNNSGYLIPNWPAPMQIKAYVTTRAIQGFSKTPFANFNLADHVEEPIETVLQNRQQLIEDLNLPTQPVWLEQIHGHTAVSLDQQSAHLQADASYTGSTNKICSILTADCLSILICNQLGTEVAAIHAGWRGLLSGVIENTINKLSSNPATLLAWLGPAIGPNHFEVNEAIRADFLQKNSLFEPGFHLRQQEHWFADIFQLARITLNHSGVTAVYGGNHCTYSDSENFYSYRRDRQITGRMASLIWIAAT